MVTIALSSDNRTGQMVIEQNNAASSLGALSIGKTFYNQKIFYNYNFNLFK